MVRTTKTLRTFDEVMQVIEDELNKSWPGWTWKALAHAAELSISTLVRMKERDYKDGPRLSTVIKLADVFGIKLTARKQVGVKLHKIPKKAA
jgi:DNA-binding XRE family transcriptional regulator